MKHNKKTNILPQDQDQPEHATSADKPSSFKRFAQHRSFKFLQLIVGLALLSLLLRKISLNEIVELFKQSITNWPFLLLAFLIPGVGIIISALRLKLLLKAQGVSLSLPQLCKANLIGSFYNQLLPSTIGGDLARGFWISRVDGFNNTPATTKPIILSFTVIGVDRFIGVIGILLTGLLAAALNPSLIRQSPGLEAFWYVAFMGGFFIALLPFMPARSIGRWFFSFPLLNKLREKAAMIYNALKAYRSCKHYLLAAFLLSLGLQFSIIAQYWVLVRALELAIPFWGLAVIVPIVSLVSMIPLTINGIGIRENMLYAIGSGIGFTISGAVALAYTFLSAKLFWAAIGGILQFTKHSQHK